MDMHPEVIGNDRYALPPQLDGDVYCSPWCGCGCTKADYDRAVAQGARLAAQMGDGWKPEIWENGGWHYKVIKGVAEIYADIDRSNGRDQAGWYPVKRYTVFFNSAKQVVTTGLTPEDALGFAVQDARGIERQIARDLAALTADGQ